METPTTQQLIQSLNSSTCPACARKKKRTQTLCGGCYRMLPPAERNDLYNLVGNGYEEAVAAAMKRLQAKKFNMPVQL